jgi:hypothetical protein
VHKRNRSIKTRRILWGIYLGLRTAKQEKSAT